MTSATRTQKLESAIPALAPERPVVWPQRRVHTLPNGLQIVLVESHTIPKFTGQLLFRSGDAAAAQEAPGLAEMTAAVVRTGTASRASREIEEELRRIGADLSTHAGADSSAISFSGLADFSRNLLHLVADLAQRASFPPDEFERERRQRLEELKVRRATPAFLASEGLHRVLFGAHPYAALEPSEAQVQAYRREHLVKFYRGHYLPGNALLVAAGDFPPDRLLEQIGEAFGSWSPARREERIYPLPPELRGRRVHLVHLPGSVQAHVGVGNRSITRAHPDWFRLALANSIYGGAFNSRLVRNIREQKGYTYSPRSAVHALEHYGYFSVHAAVRNEVTAATLTEIFYEMDRIRSLRVDDEELSDARNYLSGVFSLGLATQDGLAGKLALVYRSNLPEDYLETYRDKIRGLLADDVLSAAQRYFDSPNAQVVVVGDVSQVSAQLALFGEVDVYDAQGNRLDGHSAAGGA